jgi:hypothetical protein
VRIEALNTSLERLISTQVQAIQRKDFDSYLQNFDSIVEKNLRRLKQMSSNEEQAPLEKEKQVKVSVEEVKSVMLAPPDARTSELMQQHGFSRELAETIKSKLTKVEGKLATDTTPRQVKQLDELRRANLMLLEAFQGL